MYDIKILRRENLHHTFNMVSAKIFRYAIELTPFPPMPPQKGAVHVATDDWEDEAVWTYYPLLEEYVPCTL